MPSLPLIFLFVLISLVLPACSGVPAHDRPVSASPGPGSPEGQVPLIELDKDLLYQILEAEIAFQRRHLDVATSRYLQLARSTRDPRVAERAARVALYARDDPRSLEAAKLWLELQPRSEEPRQVLVVAAIRSGLLPTALEHLDVLLFTPEGPLEDRFDLMVTLLTREHDVHEAFLLMDSHIDAWQDDSAALLAYSHLAVRAQELVKAREAIEATLGLRPDWFSAIALYIRILQMQGEADEAKRVLAESVERNPDEMRLRVMHAHVLVEDRRYEDALEQYEVVAGQVSPNAEILFRMGLINLQLDRLEKAGRYLVRARDGDDDRVRPEFYLGWIEEKQGNNAKAIAYYASVDPEDDDHFEARVRIAVLSADNGELKEARLKLKDLRAQEPEQRKRLYQIEGELLRQNGQYDDGLEVLNAALEDFSGDFDLLYSRALLAESLDMVDLVEKDLRYILKRDPEHVDALNALGYTLADRTDRYDEAYGYIERALELRPDDHAILDSMGWVLYRLGDYDKALEYLRRSLDIKLDDEVAAHLGEVLWVSGNKEEAIAIWKKALEKFPDNENLRRVMQRFRQ